MKTGRPRIEILPAHLEEIERLAGMGVTWDGIASVLDISEKTLRRDDGCNRAYHKGIHGANLAVAGTLYSMAMSGNPTCMIFWLKTRARWSEKNPDAVERIELTGKDGEPLYGNAHDKLAALTRRLIERKSVDDAAPELDGE